MQSRFLSRLKRIAIFCQVIDSGTMRGAAEKLGMTPPAVSQYISQLEAELEVTLIYRSTRKISLSEAGEQYYRHGKKMLSAAADAEEAINELKHSLNGELRVSVPVGLATKPIAQALKPLISTNPELNLTIIAHDQYIDLIEEKVDIAVRVGEPEDSNFIYHPLGSVRKHLFSSAEYLQKNGNPVTPDDLEKHSWLGLINKQTFSEIELHHPKHKPYRLTPKLRLRFNDLNSLICHVQEGFGIAVLPELEVLHLIESGELVRVLPCWSQGNHEIHALTINKKNPMKVRAVIKALKEYFRDKG
ncbi:transcriptional regulator, LysR family [Shewanella sediminis HAW-EB3]|uniref:Transcriptional regulator, LysR family n=1 Tax=Shewanella sediminis (strain HAW-EB3) TaxID=425104 RepID=A8FSV5_SHESH|nr:LysR family transcriptional regulator [Shewanella sediminis]ABV35928.1 transcriptional regulator, LysR family [Shewanella sediminis HAW-EB3]